MRPLRLSLQAFGPFAGLEEIDFRAAHDARLFGIYGVTGAGKTSILDGICFALFGESSGEERQGEDLRSHHASPDVQTEVRLVFEVGENRYHLVRRPRQTVRALRGGGVTERPHWAALYDIGDMEITEVTAKSPGRVLEERKVEAVADQLTDILGYTARQFRQVVLLPQGRFRQLLTARSDERSEVLRGLFDVSLYERLVERLRIEAQELRSQIDQGRAAVAARLEAHGLPDLEALATRLIETGAGLTQLDAARVMARTVRDVQRTALELGRASETAFRELDAASETLAAHIEGEPVVAGLRIRRMAAMRARACEIPEGRLVETQSALEAAQLTLATKQTTAADAEERFLAAAAALVTSREAEPVRAAAATRLATLKDYRRRLETAEPLRRQASEAAAQLALTQDAFERAQADLEAASVALTAAEGVHIGAQAQAAERLALGRRLEQVQAEAVAIDRHATAVATVAALAAQLKTAEAMLSTERAELDRVAREERETEAEFLHAQAGHLALALAEGEACPVCGSTDHPAPARSAGGGRADQAALELARRSRATADGRERTAAGVVAGLQGEHAGAQRQAAGLTAPERARALVIAEKESLELSLATTIPDPDETFEALEVARHARTRQTAEHETARATFVAADKTAAAAATGLSAALADLPPELCDPDPLEYAILQTGDELSRLAAAHEAAQAGEREADQALRAARGELEYAQGVVAERVAEVDKRRTAFAAELAQNELSEAAFAAARGDIAQLEALKAEISEAERAGVAAEARLAAARRTVGEGARPDLVTLEAAATGSEAALTEAERAYTAAEQVGTTLWQTHEALDAQAVRQQALEAQFAVAGEISTLTAGRNALNIRLQDFAIAATFDTVLEAANQRFDRMSGGRFRLSRKLESGDRRTRSGLDIEVFDSHTDQRRDAHTLSGGEGFLASLSLALGLSDVVQAEAGGVKLDAIFIDEGFGHLDDETLDLALDTLRDLVGHDRAVGVISHVEAVKQQIPNGFEVERGVRGSHVIERRLS